MKPLLIYILTIIFSVIGSPYVYAGGMSTSGQGTRALSMGGAFTAVADDGSCIYYNPAGMNQTEGTTIEAGIALIYPEIKYEMSNGATQKSDKTAFGPTLFVTHTFTDKFSAGFGMYCPYSRDAKFSDDPVNGFFSQRAKIQRIDFSPIVCYKFNKQFSVGAGPIVGYGSIDQSIPAGPTLRIEDKADGFGYGGIAGILCSINEYIKIGGTYRSRMTVDHDGDRTMITGGIKRKSNASTNVHYPGSIGLGVAIMPNKNLTLAFDIDWYEWSYMKEIVTKTDLWPDHAISLNMKDSWDFRIGGEYILADTWSIRAGYAYMQGATPNTHILPCKPDADGHILDLGLRKRLGNWNIDFLYEFTHTLEEEAKANIYGFNGKYTINQHLIGLTVVSNCVKMQGELRFKIVTGKDWFFVLIPTG